MSIRLIVTGEDGWKGVTLQKGKEDEEMNVVKSSDIHNNEWKKRKKSEGRGEKAAKDAEREEESIVR